MDVTTYERSAPASSSDVDGRTDDLFDVLSDPRRRFVIACLEAHSEPMAVADVAAELTSWECDTPKDRLSDGAVEPRYLALYHVHVPKMADVGMLEWNRDRNTITLADGRSAVPSDLSLPPVG